MNCSTDNITKSYVYRSSNGSPEDNLLKVIELMGGINKIFKEDAIVIIKPNAQWWNQGTPNLAALKALVDVIMNYPGGYKGEVCVAENCHRGPTPWKSQSSAWAGHFARNSDIADINNLNELCSQLKDKYKEQFSTCHWLDKTNGAKRITGPQEGVGYVYCDGTAGQPLLSCDNGIEGQGYRATIMTYPVFKTDKGTIVDFKKGIWGKGAYTEQPFQFINLAALNHHSTYCGVTSAVKNYLGVTDLSGGSDPHNGGKLTENYYNFHSFPFNKWSPGPKPGMIGSEIGIFMNTIRKADLNITTAEWTGLASRTEPPVAHTRTILASRDTVAIDYHASKYLLYPNSKLSFHNPDNPKSPVHEYLSNCARITGESFNEENVKIKSYDFKTKTTQTNGDFTIKAPKIWTGNLKALAKFLVYRYIKR